MRDAWMTRRSQTASEPRGIRGGRAVVTMDESASEGDDVHAQQ